MGLIGSTCAARPKKKESSPQSSPRWRMEMTVSPPATASSTVSSTMPLHTTYSSRDTEHQGHSQQALKPRSEHDLRLTFRVNAHTDARRRRRRFIVECLFSIKGAFCEQRRAMLRQDTHTNSEILIQKR